MSEKRHYTASGKVTGIIANLILVATEEPVSQNEICYIKTGNQELLGEVIKVQYKDIFVQCFESTRGLKV
jgi:V/A-type H+-transporting ATPase subunit A